MLRDKTEHYQHPIEDEMAGRTDKTLVTHTERLVLVSKFMILLFLHASYCLEAINLQTDNLRQR